MSKFKKQFSFSGEGNIWRLIPDNRNHLLIETRDTENKQVFFSYMNLETGTVVLKNFQTEEKFWTGIERIHNGIIYFHKFAKPDLPGHRGIYAYDISQNTILWKKDDIVFSFMHDEKIYCVKRGFEANKNYAIDLLSGEIISEVPDGSEFKELWEKALNEEDYSDYLFPERFFPDKELSGFVGELLNNACHENQVEGLIEFAEFRDLLIYNFHIKNSDGSYNNIFRIVNPENGKILFKEVINVHTKNLVPDCFFIKGNLLFLLQEMKKVLIYKYIK
jgi:hypothetical protein